MLSIEQKIVTVSNNDVAVNAEIATQAASDWMVALIILSGLNVILLFTRPAVAT